MPSIFSKHGSISMLRTLSLGAAGCGLLLGAACSADQDDGDSRGRAEPIGRNVESTLEAPLTTPAPTDTSPSPLPSPTPTPNAADASSPLPFDMKTWRPDAKGLWIWYLDYIGLTAAQAATKAKALGVGYVLIKSGQDASFWSQRFNANVVKEFTSRGIRVLAWPYITPSGGSAAIDAAAAAAKVPGCDGLVLDVEIEWEKNGDHTAAAKALCQGIRAKAPGVWLGYTSFGWIGYHPDLPWKTFDTYCGDAYFPQVYFADRGVAWDGPKGLSQALQQYDAAQLKAPLWPIGSNDDVYGTSNGPSTSALNGFLNAAGDFTSLYAYPEKTETTKISQLSLLDWAN